MGGIGAFLIIIGVGSLILPMFDIQFTIMQLLDDYQPIAGIAIAAIGVALVLLRARDARTKVVTTDAAPAPAPMQEPPAT